MRHSAPGSDDLLEGTARDYERCPEDGLGSYWYRRCDRCDANLSMQWQAQRIRCWHCGEINGPFWPDDEEIEEEIDEEKIEIPAEDTEDRRKA